MKADFKKSKGVLLHHAQSKQQELQSQTLQKSWKQVEYFFELAGDLDATEPGITGKYIFV